MKNWKRIVTLLTCILMLVQITIGGYADALDEYANAKVTIVDNGDGTVTQIEEEKITGEDINSPEEIAHTPVNTLLQDINLNSAEEKQEDNSSVDFRSDEVWEYKIDENGWASITSVKETETEKLVIPEKLDGLIVAGIDRDAFVACTRLSSLTVPLSVVFIDDGAFNGVSEQVCVHGEYGSEVARFANAHGIPFEANTTLYFTDRVIDFTNIRKDAFTVNENVITIDGPEGLLIDEGSIIFCAGTQTAYKATRIVRDNTISTIEILEPEAGECFTRIKADFLQMHIDWGKAYLAEGTTVYESTEKNISGSISSTIVNITFSVEPKIIEKNNEDKEIWKKKKELTLKATGSLKITIDAKFDVSLLSQEIYEAEFTVKKEFSYTTELEGKYSFDVLLADIPLTNFLIGSVNLKQSFHIEVSGKINFSYSNYDLCGVKYNPHTCDWDPIDEHGQKKSVDVSATLKIGPLLETEFKLFGHVVAKFKVFSGIKATVKIPLITISTAEDENTGKASETVTTKPVCMDVDIQLVLEPSITIDLWDICKFSVPFATTSLQVGHKPTMHLEYHQGRWKRMEQCTYNDGNYAKVTLVLNNGEANQLYTMEKHKTIDTKTLDSVAESLVHPGYEFNDWYIDQEFAIPYDYSQWITEDLTLYARWYKNSRELHIHNEVQGDRTIKVPAEQPIVNFIYSDFKEVQYEFLGLYLDPSFTIPVADDTLMTDETTDLYVKWKYNPAYNPFEGEKSIALLTFTPDPDSFGKNVIVTACKKGAPAITVPDYYMGKKVIGIGSNCFENCNELKMVELGANITYIDNYAFSGCTKLNYIGMPGSLKTIGKYAFLDCSALKSALIPPNVVSIGIGAFKSAGLERVTIPNAVASGSNSMFAECKSLTTAVIPNTWVSIPEMFFQGCSQLYSVNLPSNLTSIGLSAFDGCEMLNIETIPGSVKSIGNYAFRDCKSIIRFTVPSSVTILGSGTFQNATQLNDIDIPNTVTTINTSCFEGCESLSGVILPANLKTIGSYAFRSCHALEEINIPETVTSIGDGAFVTSGLKSISLPTKMTYVPAYLVQGCTSLTDVQLHEGLISIGSYAFMFCKSLEKVDMPDSMRTIGEGAFRECDKLSELNLNDGLTSLGKNFIQDTVSLVTLDIPASVSSLSSYAFSKCYVTELIIPNGITSLPSFIFDGAHCKYIHLPSTLTSLGTQCFTHCEELVEMFLPYGVKNIGSWEFGYCYSLRKVWIPPTVTSIGAYAFRTDLFGSYVNGMEVFGEANTIAPAFFETINSKYNWSFHEYVYERPDGNQSVRGISLDGFEYVIIDDEATIIDYTGNAINVIIPDTLGGAPVTALGPYSIPGEYESVQIPASMKDIDPTAFEDAPNLYNIYVTSGNTTFVTYSGCLYRYTDNGLIFVKYTPAWKNESYTLRSNTVGIAGRAFSNCDYLKYITIPNTVEFIEDLAFYGCDELTQVTFSTTPSITDISQHAFDNCDAVIYCRETDGYVSCYVDEHNLPFNLYKITYLLENSELYTSVIEAGTLLGEPIQLEDEYKCFDGWYTGTNKRTLWNFETGVMPFNDMSLYGYWNSEFSYVNRNGEITITGYQGNLSDVIIPETIGGLPVTTIAADAFISNKDHTYNSITIPFSVETIEANAISGVSSICGDIGYASETYAEEHGIQFHSRQYTLSFDCGYGAPIVPLQYAVGETITIPETIWDNNELCGWFTLDSYEQEWLETKMPPHDVHLVALWGRVNGATDIDAYQLDYTPDGAYILSYNGRFPEVVIPEILNGYTVIGISDYAFYGNQTLVSLTLPDTVKTIGKYAFGNSNLTEIELGEGITSIGDYAFTNCTRLERISLPSGVTVIPKGMLANCSNIKKFEIGEQVIEIKENAFSGATHLSSLTLGNGIRIIGDYAFSECTALGTVILPDNIETIGKSAFNDCSALVSIVLNPNNQHYTVLNDCALLTADMTKLLLYAPLSAAKSFTIPETVNYIDDNVFENAKNLNTVVFSSKSITIGESIFRNAHALSQVIFKNNSLSVLPANTFSGCTKLSEISLPDGLLMINDGAFSSSGVAEITIPASVVSISENAFMNCGQFTIVGTRKSYAQEYAEQFDYAFIALGEMVPVMQAELPVLVTVYQDEYYQLPFKIFPQRYSRSDVTWLNENPEIVSVDDKGIIHAISCGETVVRIEYNNRTLAECRVVVSAKQQSRLLLPSSTLIIDEQAFDGVNVRIVDLRGTNCKRIETCAFADSPSLVNILLPSTVEYISDDAFSGSPSVLLVFCNDYVATYAETHGICHKDR